MTFPLTVGVQASLEKLEKDYDKAVDMTAKTVETIEEKFKDANPELSLDSFKSALAGIAGASALIAVVSLVSEANKQMAELADKSREVAATTDQFQEWVYALRTGGASAKEAQDAIKAIAEKLNEARRSGENDFTKMLDVNGQKWKDQEGTIIDINTALGISQSLIRNAATELDKVDIGKHLGLSEEATHALDRMPGVFEQVAAKAREAGAVADAATIQKAKEFTEEWNKTALAWETRFKSAVITITGWIDQLIDQSKGYLHYLVDPISEVAPELWSKISAQIFATFPKVAEALHAGLGGDFEGRFTGVTEDITKAGEAVEATLPKIVDWFRGLGNVAGDDSAKVQKLINDVLKLATTPIGPPTKFPKDKEDDDKKDTFDTTADRIKRRADLYDAETVSVGRNTFAKEKAKATADLLAAAERAERDVDEDLKKEIDELAQKYATAADSAARAKQKYESMNQALTYGGDEAIRILDGVRTKSLTGQEAVRELENSLITMLEKAALLGQGPLAGLLGTAAAPGTGGVGGLLGLLFGGARAGGGDVESGKTYLVGEEGPELMRMGANGTVLPNRVISNVGGASQVNHFEVNFGGGPGSFDPADAMAHAAVMRRAFNDMMTAHVLQQMRSGGVFNPNHG
jgi:hypothetical protein